MKKYNLEVEIKNIEVEDRYYSFNYKITLDGKVRKQEYYEDDFDNGMTDKEWKEELESGYALECALQDFEIN